VYFFAEASKYHMEFVFFKTFQEKINSSPSNIKDILQKFLILNGLYSISFDFSYFLESGYYTSKETYFVKKKILYLINELKYDTLGCIEAISPPDIIIWSALGKSDGNAYKNLFDMIKNSNNCFERLKNWKDFRKPVELSNLFSKL
jgi:acyl-CoA oxidase